MDMMLQLMARQMGINIDDLYVAPVQEVVDSLGGIETHIVPPSYDFCESQVSTYEAFLGDGDATIVE